MVELLVNQEFRTLIPPLDPNEYAGLEASVLEEGVRDALIVWNGYIVDGHNRYDIITKHGLTDYRVIVKNFPDAEAAKMWIKKNQIGRRNIAPFLRGEYYLEVKAWEDRRAEAKAFKGNQHTSSPFQNSEKTSVNTTKELATALKVSTDTASRLIQIHERAPEQIKEKCRTGEISINEAYTEVRKQKSQERKEVRQQQIATEIKDKPQYQDDAGILLGDLSILNEKLADNEADLFLTDPPYSEDCIPLFERLADLAQKKLRPGGLCLVYTPHPHLPRIIDIMQKHLTYCWIFALEQMGAEARIWKHNIWVKWKPILVFTKTPYTQRLTDTWVMDSIRGAGEDKRFHEWGQDVQEATYWIEALTHPNGLVVDPFCGGGTVPVASKVTGRRWLGCDIDISSVTKTRTRLNGNS